MKITLISSSAARKKTPVASNVVLTVKPGDTFEIKRACTLGTHKLSPGSTLQIQSYRRGSDILSVDHIDRQEGLTFFSTKVSDFIDAQKCMKKILTSNSRSTRANTSTLNKIVELAIDPETDADALRSIRAYWKDKTYATFSRVKSEFVVKPAKKSITDLQMKAFADRFKPFALKPKARNVVKSGKVVTTNYYVLTKFGAAQKITQTIDPEVQLASKVGVHSKDLNNKLNAKSKQLDKVFGYWRVKHDKELAKLPFPVAVDVPGYDKAAFIKRLNAFLKEAKKLTNKGSSSNRWTGSANGASEYKHPSGWSIPDGALYYLQRGVPPTQEFYKAVTGRTNSKLPSAKNYVIK